MRFPRQSTLSNDGSQQLQDKKQYEVILFAQDKGQEAVCGRVKQKPASKLSDANLKY
jgi:hypothetical protein